MVWAHHSSLLRARGREGAKEKVARQIKQWSHCTAYLLLKEKNSRHPVKMNDDIGTLVTTLID